MRTKPPRERESKIQRSIVVRLRRLGIILHRRNVAAWQRTDNGRFRFIRCGKAGQSDLYGWDLKTARHWEIETKAKGEKPTPKQLEWLLECHGQGCVAFWSDSADIAERVAEAVLRGGKIAWRDDGTFDVEVD